MTFRAKLILAVLWISSLVAVGAWAQTQVKIQSKGAPRFLSGSDIAFRIDRTDVEGTPIGTLVVKIDGKWVEPSFSQRVKPMAR